MELKQFKIDVLPLRDKLLSYARKLTEDPSDAEDAVQEIMLKLWNMQQKLHEYRSIEALAMTMTHHLCMDMWRTKRPDALSLDLVQAQSPSATPERLLEEKDESKKEKDRMYIRSHSGLAGIGKIQHDNHQRAQRINY